MLYSCSKPLEWTTLLEDHKMTAKVSARLFFVDADVRRIDNSVQDIKTRRGYAKGHTTGLKMVMQKIRVFI